MMLVDWWQLPPIPDSGALFLPPLADASKDNKSERTRRVQDMFWQEGNDTINFLAELSVQKRQEDSWLSEVLFQCRNGSLSAGDYFFLMGLPTHCGSWLSPAETNSCGSAACETLTVQWRRLAEAGVKWASMVLMECVECATERRRRNRLIEPQDPRIRQSPFIDAPYVHQHNEPTYHALLLRAVENAKRGSSKPAHILWVVAQDSPTNPAEVASSPA